jgi:hypothetical protein
MGSGGGAARSGGEPPGAKPNLMQRLTGVRRPARRSGARAHRRYGQMDDDALDTEMYI